MSEVGQVSEFGWYRPTKSVAREVEAAARLERLPSSDSVLTRLRLLVLEVQQPEVGQVSEFGWYRPTETLPFNDKA